MADIFYAGMPDWLDALNQLANGQLEPIQVDWNAMPGSIKAILNKPILAAVATSGSKGDIGLGNVDNTSDANKPVSILQQAALDRKAAKGSKADAGLSNVDNTSDANKPVSILQQAALNLKVNAASPSTTGTWSHSGGSLSLNSGAANWGSLGSASASSSYLAFIRGGTSAPAGYIGTDGGGVISGGSGTNLVLRATNYLQLGADSGAVLPITDATATFGSSGYRWTNSYFTVSPTITSDAREKDRFRVLTPTEIAAAADLARAIGVYRWKTAIMLKGDGAREHIGPTVQAAIQIMESYGLDPFKYGFICYDSWQGGTIEHAAIEATDDREMQAAWTETIPAGDRYAFRYDELNQFIAAGFEARQAAIEARLAALESAVP
ncbi:hypothetical protein JAB9_47740 [Janthinobacterium sp. HH107]|uniref:tail fiber domain-containing protein n=1 Tax=Janthinobacterium sp. HH107 TaxID=1537279 RepID=UPI000873DB47|nr:tail fiber domain-containing protein [Janthinobacterium sp. HH107]OEZ92207.1 hypothetical protein JAB9_47740 [Janthinobacterium sp. HH107]